LGNKGQHGVKGDLGRTGLCIATPEWNSWVRSLDAWITAWNDFQSSGGLEPCQDYRDAVREVDDFLDDMIDWYNDLLNERMSLYEQMFDRLDRDIEDAFLRCQQAQNDQRSAITSQFDDIQSQIDFIWNNPNPNGGRP
jgi:hypothetical protein